MFAGPGNSIEVARILAEIDDHLNLASVVMHYSPYLIEQSVAQPDAEPGLNVHMGQLIQTGGSVNARPIFTISRDRLRFEVAHGRIPRLLGHMWAVFVFAAWEHDYRRRLASATGRKPDDIKVSMFGDLRHVRHDILHNQGVASDDHTGKCVVLRWFRPGDPIDIVTDHVLDFQAKWAEARSRLVSG